MRGDWVLCIVFGECSASLGECLGRGLTGETDSRNGEQDVCMGAKYSCNDDRDICTGTKEQGNVPQASGNHQKDFCNGIDDMRTGKK